MWSFIIQNGGNIIGEMNTSSLGGNLCRVIRDYLLKLEMCVLHYEAVCLLAISIVWEKEVKERPRGEISSPSDKVSSVDEGRGRAGTRIGIIFPSEHGLKPFTPSAIFMKCLRSKTHQPFVNLLLSIFPSLHQTQWNISKMYFNLEEEHTHLQFIFLNFMSIFL